MKRTPATLYSTWLQLATPTKPAYYLFVIALSMSGGEVAGITFIKLDGSLENVELTPQKVQEYIDSRVIVPCVLVPPNQDRSK